MTRIPATKGAKPHHIWMVTSEISPLRTTGGLGHAVHGLSQALVQAGHRVSVFVPAHAQTLGITIRKGSESRKKIIIDSLMDREIIFRGKTERAWIFRADIPFSTESSDLIKYYFIDNESGTRFSNRKVYGYADDARRYLYFNQVVAELARLSQTGEEEQIEAPDIIHCHDWGTGYIGYFLSHVQKNQVPLVYNIHNLSYSKRLTPHAFYLLTREEDKRLYSWEGMEFYGSIDPHKTAFIFSNRIVTVSPNYKNEILSDPIPGGDTNLYAGVLQANQSKLKGILNGIPDYYGVDHFYKTGVLPESYGSDNLEGKKACRQHLQEVAELKPHDQSLLLASTGRWDEQKGTDLVLKVLPELMQDLDLQFVSIGSEARGKKFRRAFLRLKNRFPERLAVLDFHAIPRPHLSAENLESLALAGADALLMPSRFEPCGLSQMYALKHGTPVIANRTGGLADTIEHGKTGFLFEGVTPENIKQSIRDAYAIFKGNSQKWQSMIQAAMQKDFSWKAAAQEYIDLYQEVIQS